MSGLTFIVVGVVILVVLFAGYYFMMTNAEQIGEEEEKAVAKKSETEVERSLVQEDQEGMMEDEMGEDGGPYH